MSCSQTHTSNAWLSTTCVIQSLLNACLFSIQSHTTHDEKLSDPSTQYNLIFFSSFAGCFKADFLKGTNNRNRTTRKSKGWITPLFFTQNLLPITQSPAGQTHHYTNCAFIWIDPNFKKIFNQMYWRYRQECSGDGPKNHSLEDIPHSADMFQCGTCCAHSVPVNDATCCYCKADGAHRIPNT